MGRAPCCDKANVKRGPWSPEEDATLKNYLHKYGTGGNWISLPQRAGLKRCGKSCRLRWLNYLRPDIKHGAFTEEEDNIIISLYSKMGSRWSVIAANIPGRTDNDVKNHWNTKLKKKLFGGGNNNNKFNPSTSITTTTNIPFTNNIINMKTNLIIQPPNTSYSTPTPSPSPSPTYVDNINPNHNHDQNNNNNNYHDQQFYVPITSFSSLLAQCTTTPMPLGSNFMLTNLDPPYGHDPVPSSNSTHYPIQQAQMMAPIHYCSSSSPATTVSSIAELSISDVYGSSLEDDQLLEELGFGLVQQVLVSPTCNNSYGDDQDDIKPQGLGQGVTNY